ncbi:epoxide hydrolase-like protein [Massariosphaeria phaeospora]|uniref:Epoxide hydrolase-like protein n=1 Tax=Massariosphaeria phaeospora TaxID=100035 RepID=A0A7C8M515_9PLEO|nr:epoxide hydrolase-like protein [Massariosphaeria phaeospora]
MAYSPPNSAQPFTLNISDDQISEWSQLLKLSKIGPLTWEGKQADRRFGVTHNWLSSTKAYWLNTYDWRAQEQHINSFPNYTMAVEDMDIHFVALFSEQKDAIPLIFMHGWPGSFIEFLPMLSNIREKYSAADLPYHIIVPSLPGYTLSSGGPVDSDWTIVDSARVMNQLMLNLGFEKYIAQGGDIGSFVGTLMAVHHDACVGVHLNLMRIIDLPEEEGLSALEQRAVANAKKWRESGSAYAQEHGTRPNTISLVLSSSPLALLAWIGEKFLEWSDEDPPLDTILTNVSLYWFTQGFPRSIYPYRSLFGGPRNPPPYIAKPMGFSFFPVEITPGVKSTVEKHGNLAFYRQHESGGHFAALEKPEWLWRDVEDYVELVWKKV